MASLPIEHRRYAAVLIADDHSDIHSADVSWWLCRAGVTDTARLAELLPMPSIYGHTGDQHDRIVSSEIAATKHDAIRAAARWLTRMQLAATTRHVSDLPTDSEFPDTAKPRRPGWLHVEPLVVHQWNVQIRLLETVHGHGRRVTAWTPRICHGRSVGRVTLAGTTTATECPACGQMDYPLCASEPVDETQTTAEAAVRAAWRVGQAVDMVPYPACWTPTWRPGAGLADDGQTASPTPHPTHHSEGAR